MKKTYCVVLSVIVMCLCVLVPLKVQAEEGFPVREKYSDVPFITTEQLFAEYDSIIIVDVRSKFEYDVIHIAKAAHIILSKKTFVEELSAVRAKDGTVKMAFYCNGHTCEKSYEATQQAMEAGFKNVYTYDAGIFDWANAYPELSTLMGQTPVDKEKLISKEGLNKRFVSYEEILEKASDSNNVIIDIRDPFQREKIPNIPGLRNIPLDRMLVLLQEGEFKSNHLYFIDAVGKQVRWLQYHLESNGYINYNFLEKGVLSTQDFK
ncbi:MAG: rhodanese-like domain-containing protein [Candidatus Omnitrophica bacterium]|nr:rhodanese-like domain-containing protein [Candidatus Omnitrophota bacterium]MCG2710853.1 rhodanese-like domain-containing protein [Candidatus Omnitrophota bacterium]